MPRYFTVVCRLEGSATGHTIMDAVDDIGQGVVLAAVSHGHSMDEANLCRAALKKVLEVEAILPLATVRQIKEALKP